MKRSSTELPAAHLLPLLAKGKKLLHDARLQMCRQEAAFQWRVAIISMEKAPAPGPVSALLTRHRKSQTLQAEHPANPKSKTKTLKGRLQK